MKTWLLLFSFALSILGSNFQVKAQVSPPSITAKVSPLRTSPLAGQHQKPAAHEAWEVSFGFLGKDHTAKEPKTKLDRIKAIKTQQKIADQGKASTPQRLSSATAPLQPILQTNFGTNFNALANPPDNNMAISNGGKIVSVVNGSIFFSDENGTQFGEERFSSFFSSLGLGSSEFDPKAIYDPIEDRFIVVCLNGNTPDNSNVIIAFSKNNNPLNGWNFYLLPGDPLGQNWFDYPSIGISETELFISGNLFNGGFSKTLVYQIEKAKGFSGEDLNWRYWDDLKTADGESSFTVCPISAGFDIPVGPGIYLISRRTFENKLSLYQITATIDNDPEMTVQDFDLPEIKFGGLGLQKGTIDLLDIGRLELIAGFYANSTIHFVLDASSSGPYTGILYGRIDLNTMTISHSFYQEAGFDCAYPNIAPFALTPDDKTVIFSFLRTGFSIYPEFRTIVCNENFEWSNSVLIRQGDSYSAVNIGTERWGDYTGISRRHNALKPEVWMAGCYGTQTPLRELQNWIGQVVANDGLKIPQAEFRADDTLVFTNNDKIFTFSDLSINDPTSWSWSFPGGTPSTSTERDPEIQYFDKGVFSVTLIASNALGSDTITKTDYIKVAVSTFSEFEADKTIISPGDEVSFTSLSTNAETFNWSFPGGSPSSSNEANPVVTYNTEGLFDVTLATSNPWSADQDTKANYIIVNANNSPPSTDFRANETTIDAGNEVKFFDLSTNNPTSWSWTFPGGTPATSTKKIPSVTYNTPGLYDVSLVAGNTFGDSTATKIEYIQVTDQTATQDLSHPLRSITVYPNPATPQDRITLDFSLDETLDLNFLLFDSSGKLVKRLLRSRSKAGKNQLSFQIAMLSSGTYNLVLQDQQNRLIGTRKLVIRN